MNSIHRSNADYNRLMDAARERARVLRRQAIRDLWDGVEAVAGRAARRLASSLERHGRLRAQPE